MTTSSAHKLPMKLDPTDEQILQGKLKEARFYKTQMDKWRKLFEQAIEGIRLLSPGHLAEFQPSINDSARTTDLLLEIVRDNNGKLDKEQLIDEARKQGLGRGKTEGKRRGSIGAQIEKLLHRDSGKLKTLANGKIALG